MFALVSVLSVTMNGTLVMITCVCKPVHIITNTNRISNWLIGMWAEKKKTYSHHLLSSQLSQECHVTLPLSVTSTVCSRCKRAAGRKQCVQWGTCHCEWCAPVWGCCPPHSVSDQLPPILQAKTLSISSHYSVTWNHGAKKPNQLLRLLNESNFLPESTRRAHTSIATLNYLTLIQINKSHRHQDCATPQRQTMTMHLYHCMKTASYSIARNTVNNLI